MRHLDHAKGEPCSVCDQPLGPWWFAGEPHVAFDGRVYCPHCSMPLGATMDAALGRRAFHRKDMCEAWGGAVRDRIEVEAVQEDSWR